MTPHPPAERKSSQQLSPEARKQIGILDKLTKITDVEREAFCEFAGTGNKSPKEILAEGTRLQTVDGILRRIEAVDKYFDLNIKVAQIKDAFKAQLADFHQFMADNRLAMSQDDLESNFKQFGEITVEVLKTFKSSLAHDKKLAGMMNLKHPF